MPQKICQACLLAKFWIPRNYLDFNRVRNILDLGLGLSKISQNSHTPKRAMSRVSRVVIVWTTEVSTMKTNLIDYCNIIIIDGSIILVVQHYRFCATRKDCWLDLYHDHRYVRQNSKPKVSHPAIGSVLHHHHSCFGSYTINKLVRYEGVRPYNKNVYLSVSWYKVGGLHVNRAKSSYRNNRADQARRIRSRNGSN